MEKNSCQSYNSASFQSGTASTCCVWAQDPAVCTSQSPHCSLLSPVWSPAWFVGSPFSWMGIWLRVPSLSFQESLIFNLRIRKTVVLWAAKQCRPFKQLPFPLSCVRGHILKRQWQYLSHAILELQVASKLLCSAQSRYCWAGGHVYASPPARGNSRTKLSGMTEKHKQEKAEPRKRSVLGQSEKALCFPAAFLASNNLCLGNLLKYLRTLHLLALNEGHENEEQSVSSLSCVNLWFCILCEECDTSPPPFPLETFETDLDPFLLQSTSFCWRNHLSDLNEQ